MVVESSLSRRRDFEITAWVVAVLPAAAASWRYVRNLWINEPQFRKMNLHLWHQGDTFQQMYLRRGSVLHRGQILLGHDRWGIHRL